MMVRSDNPISHTCKTDADCSDLAAGSDRCDTELLCQCASRLWQNRAAHAAAVGTAGASGSARAGVGDYIYAQSGE